VESLVAHTLGEVTVASVTAGIESTRGTEPRQARVLHIAVEAVAEIAGFASTLVRADGVVAGCVLMALVSLMVALINV